MQSRALWDVPVMHRSQPCICSDVLHAGPSRSRPIVAQEWLRSPSAATMHLRTAPWRPTRSRRAIGVHSDTGTGSISSNSSGSGVARKILSSSTLEGGSMLPFLAVSEAYWKAMRNQGSKKVGKVPPVVFPRPGQRLAQEEDGCAASSTYDAVVCGGTLGLFVALALQLRGHKVCVVDKRLVQGRSQEWNISRAELQSLARVGLLSDAELQQCVVSEYNPIRVGFKGGLDLLVTDCLNLGVSPRVLLDKLRAKFLAAGGCLLEDTEFKKAEVFEDGVRLLLSPVGAGRRTPIGVGDANRPNGVGAQDDTAASTLPSLSAAEATNATNATGSSSSSGSGSMDSGEAGFNNSGGVVLRTRLLLDCMGHYSPIVKQHRGTRRADGVVMVVGSCASGFPASTNSSADLLYTNGDAEDDMQVFWEAFPAEGGAARTTYMFAYTDAHPSRPSFEQFLDNYFAQLPLYQGVPLEALQFKRVLFGAFPCYSDGPLQPKWDRVLQIGDASAAQSPLSFGGFGSMLRHLPRLTAALDQALREGRLSRAELGWCHPYQPSLSASWLFQRSMSVAPGQLQRAPQPAMERRATSGDTSSSNRNGTSGVDGSSSSSNLANGSSSSSSNNQSSWPAWARLPAGHVNAVLACNFSVMKVLGDWALRPFLQDTIQLVPLGLAMTGMMLRNPLAVSRVLLQVGPATLLGWFRHFFALVAYTLLYAVLKPVLAVLPPKVREAYVVARLMEALQYGSGLDYHGHQQPQVHGQAQLNGSPPSPCAPDSGTLHTAPSSQHPVLAA